MPKLSVFHSPDKPVTIVFPNLPPTNPLPPAQGTHPHSCVRISVFRDASILHTAPLPTRPHNLHLSAHLLVRSRSVRMSDLMWALVSAQRHKGCFDLVASHVLIEHVLDFVCAPADPWTCIDRLHMDRKDLLGLIPKLACVSKE